MVDPVMQQTSSPDVLKQTSSSSGSLILYTIIALGLALFIRFYIAAPYVVSGASMDPTFHDWHYLIIDRVSYELGEPSRGDVIVFDLPGSSDKSLIKRVIGLPDETVILHDDSVRIVNDAHPEGFVLDESYLDPANLAGSNEMQVTLSEGEYFVLGDNRRLSSDSRIWGVLPRENIVGRAFVRLYPLDKINFFPGQARYSEE